MSDKHTYHVSELDLTFEVKFQDDRRIDGRWWPDEPESPTLAKEFLADKATQMVSSDQLEEAIVQHGIGPSLAKRVVRKMFTDLAGDARWSNAQNGFAISSRTVFNAISHEPIRGWFMDEFVLSSHDMKRITEAVASLLPLV